MGAAYVVDADKAYPPTNGLYLWGGTDAGDVFYWRCLDPDPDSWTVAVELRSPRQGKRWFEHSVGTVEFLTGLVDGSSRFTIGVKLNQSPHSFQGWRAFDLQVRAQHPDYTGPWPPR